MKMPPTRKPPPPLGPKRAEKPAAEQAPADRDAVLRIEREGSGRLALLSMHTIDKLLDLLGIGNEEVTRIRRDLSSPLSTRRPHEIANQIYDLIAAAGAAAAGDPSSFLSRPRDVVCTAVIAGLLDLLTPAHASSSGAADIVKEMVDDGDDEGAAGAIYAAIYDKGHAAGREVAELGAAYTADLRQDALQTVVSLATAGVLRPPGDAGVIAHLTTDWYLNEAAKVAEWLADGDMAPLLRGADDDTMFPAEVEMTGKAGPQ